MTLTDRLKGVAIAMVILVICFPIAVVVTLLSSPFWSWFEHYFEIEAFGHSGPAEWCYLVSYTLIITLWGAIWWRAGKRAAQRE